MFSLAVILVLGSGCLHSIWNLYTKRSINKSVFLWFCQLVAIVVFLPWTIVEWDSGIPLIGYWAILASMILHGLYIKLLADTYSVGDLSQVYPIMRGTSPLLVPLLGVLLLKEKLTVMGWIGIIIIVVGIVFVSNVKLKRNESFSSLKAPLLALAVGICITSYIIVDKVALAYVSPVVLNQATNIGNLFALSWATFNFKGIRNELKVNWRIMLLGGIIAPAGYLLFLFALSLAPVAQLAPMREIGTVFGTVLGIFILQEKQGKRRLISSFVITLGVIIVGVWG